MLSKSTINNYVLPFRIEAPHDIIPFFSLEGTGYAGQFVTVGRSDPADMAATFSATPVGAGYEGTVSLRPENKNKVIPAPTGSTKYQVLGMTLKNTQEVDPNGLPYIYHYQGKVERNVVYSGEAVPVTTKGIYMLRSGAYIGTPAVGMVGVISQVPGVITVTDPATIGTGGYWKQEHVLGKFLSATGQGFDSSYALFKIEL